MTDTEKNVLLHMHQFYTEEARHQRTMMWETVKWFTPILTLIACWGTKYYIHEYLPCKDLSIWLLLLAFSIFGLCLCICCILLLRSFYRTNLKYISMFAKVEEELKFDLEKRGDSKFFPGDEHITWKEWREDRQRTKKYTSKDYLGDKLSKKCSIFKLMRYVFIFFTLIFLVSILLLIWDLLT